MTTEELEKENKQLKYKIGEVGVWLVTEADKLDENDLRAKAVELLGEHAYLREVLEREIEISDFDKRIIYSIL